MKDNNGFIGAKVPMELEEKFRRLSEEHNINRSSVVRKKIEEWIREIENKKAVK
jgi:predicted DNA-binding protein